MAYRNFLVHVKLVDYFMKIHVQSVYGQHNSSEISIQQIVQSFQCRRRRLNSRQI